MSAVGRPQFAHDVIESTDPASERPRTTVHEAGCRRRCRALMVVAHASCRPVGGGLADTRHRSTSRGSRQGRGRGHPERRVGSGRIGAAAVVGRSATLERRRWSMRHPRGEAAAGAACERPRRSASRPTSLPEEPHYREGDDDHNDEEHDCSLSCSGRRHPSGAMTLLLSIRIRWSPDTSNRFL